MTWISLAAVFVIIWWIMLFVSLPFGLRTQDEDGEIVPGSTESAPRGPHMLKALIRTTILTLIVFAIFYVVTRVLGYSFDDIPRIAPEFY
ncbi:DUF1467 family protein [Nitratireductor luteus]|uniref:DUF1467 family protein n=1 Tax=Nitratireductor luteus TaxID=2976980 RepID=UPI00223EBCC0|nr:DUF1467 family protein [Nitratireductor luteus]